jgi:phosphoenolpyruvate synthase/pyruvate phosphate dikinase
MAEVALLQGIAASPGRRCGRARVLVRAADLSEVAAGEILVTRFATPDVVLVFDRIAGFVTDQGGRSAHAAVVAREFGVPAVVGAQVATREIPDGSDVALDGTEGSVRLLNDASR